MSAPTKCPCCNNPWQVGGDMLQFCGVCSTPEDTKEEENKFGVSPEILASDDFYLYANKKWIDANPIPSGYPNWNTFLHLHTLSQERLKDLLTELKDSTLETGTEDSKKLAAFYQAAMNEEAIEEAAIRPMSSLLDLCEQISSSKTSELAKNIGQLLMDFGVSTFFCIGASPDNNDSDHSIAQIAQGGLGLPDRDYYFDEDKEEKRTLYKKHVALMLTLLQQPDATEPNQEEIENAELVYDLELKLAQAHMTKTENRDPETTYNKMSIDKLSSELCSKKFDWPAFFRSATNKSPEELGDVNVRNIKAIECAADIISSVEPKTLLAYLRWRSVNSCASYLPKAFVMAKFDFFEKTLAGVQEIKPRWKRAMQFVENALGEALGQLYCEKYFDESCKEQALQIVEAVRQALEERLMEVEWMKSPSTREQALLKMNQFKVKIGYPDEWIDYSSLKIGAEETFLEMIFASRKFEHLREVKEMNAPTDKKKWFMTPQTINAYYHPNMNEIVFPAAILQAPMFDPSADIATNFGAIGAVVGHEMTHGFDDKGRKFNFEGNMVDWWTKEDSDEYESRVQVMVDQANDYQVHDQNLKGQLTCGENIADLGGLRLALRALMSQPGYDEMERIEGFNPVQRFFLGWANCWRQNITKERSLQLLTLDPHGPNPMRCNGPLSNMPEFHTAFHVSETSPMYRKAEDRVDIW